MLRPPALVAALVLPCGLLPAITTTTTLSSVTPGAPLFGQVVTLRAVVTPALAPGAVSFMDGGSLVGVGTLNNSGIAQSTTITLSAGTHTLRAVYGGGSGGYTASQSATMPYTVTAVPGTGFASAVNYLAGTTPSSVAAGDFNGDGVTDLAVSNRGTSTSNVSVLLGNGNGTFQAAMNTGNVASDPRQVAVGDFNADGREDLVVVSTSGNISVMLGNGNGTFQAAMNFGVPTQAPSVAVGDFNGDGKADLVVASGASEPTVTVLLGNGNGTFQAPVSYMAGPNPQYVAVGDFNGAASLTWSWPTPAGAT